MPNARRDLLSRPSLRGVMVASCLASATCANSQPLPGGRSTLFEHVAGSWSGTGTAAVAGGNPERIRCRAQYTPSGAARLHLALRCASDAFNLQIESDIARDGDRIAGTWTETSVGVSGEVAGVVGADRLRATVAGMGLSAVLAVTVRGDAQSVTLSSEGQFSASASLTLRRA